MPVNNSYSVFRVPRLYRHFFPHQSYLCPVRSFQCTIWSAPMCLRLILLSIISLELIRSASPHTLQLTVMRLLFLLFLFIPRHTWRAASSERPLLWPGTVHQDTPSLITPVWQFLVLLSIWSTTPCSVFCLNCMPSLSVVTLSLPLSGLVADGRCGWETPGA